MIVNPHYGEAFVEHADLEVIAHEIGCATAMVRRAEETLRWLQDLRATRRAQIAAGTWPAVAPDSAEVRRMVA